MNSWMRFLAIAVCLVGSMCDAAQIAPTANFFPYIGNNPSGPAGNGTVVVSAPPGTTWTAVSNVSWITVATGASGIGNGSVTFSVASNTMGALRTGTITIAGQIFTVTQLGPPSSTFLTLIEYHNSAQDDFFLTGDASEQATLDAAAMQGAVWSRTGLSFLSGGDASVYRFIYRSMTGTNTHFYTVNTNEQSSLLANYPIWVLESPTAFYMKAANPNQTCAAGYLPVYRAANEQTGSHRFTTIQSGISEVLARGWTNEGVAFCAPASSASGTQTAEGFWNGSTSSGRSLTAFVLDNGVYYFRYSVANDPSTIGGFLQGTGTSANGVFSSSDAKNFSLETNSIISATISASYSYKLSFSGTVSYSSLGLSTSYSSNYNAFYDLQPNLSAVAGYYNGQAAFIGSGGGTEFAAVTILPDGGYSGTTAGGCSFAGTYTPRPRGNVYGWNLNFSGNGCPPGITNNSYYGAGYYDPGSGQLNSLAVDTPRANGFIFIGLQLNY